MPVDDTALWPCPKKGCGHANSPETRKCAACGVTICGAKTRRGSPCVQTILGPNGRCKMHGATALAGPAHPNYKHGRYADVLPLRMHDRYAAAMNDPELLSLQPELATLDARISELVQRVDTGESGAAWKRIGALVAEVIEARQERDYATMDDRLAALAALSEGQSDEGAWQDVFKAWNQRQRLVESERRRLLDAQMYVSVGHVSQVFAALAESLRRNVRDPAERQGVVQTMRRLLGESRPSPLPEAV